MDAAAVAQVVRNELERSKLATDIRQLQGALTLRGQGVVVGTGVAFVDLVVTDNLNTATAKRAVATWDVPGGTFAADILEVFVQAKALNTTTIRAITKGGGNIVGPATVALNYWIWPA